VKPLEWCSATSEHVPVEVDLSKVDVESSNLFSRSLTTSGPMARAPAEALCGFDRLPNYRDETITAWLCGRREEYRLVVCSTAAKS